MKKTAMGFLIVVALCAASISCNKDEVHPLGTVPGGTNQETSPSAIDISWTDSFSSSAELKKNWILYGNPEPEWKEAAFGRDGVFDNNGAAPTSNYAVSQSTLNKSKSYTVETEIMISIHNPEGSCVCPGIAVSRDEFPLIENNEIPTIISMRVVYVGANAIWFPEWLRGHTWILMQYLSLEEDIYSSYVPADLLNGDWHSLKIAVAGQGYPTFYCDNKLIWAPIDEVLPLNSDKKIILGYTSGGDPENLAGYAYHNWVKANCKVPVKEER
jgi:hypothetical protein